MRLIDTDIHIPTSPERVWEVLTDFGSYGEWNPFFVAVDGVAEASTRLDLHAKFSSRLGPQVFTVTVRTVDPQRALLWGGGLPIKGIADGAHGFELTPQDGGTSLRHYERLTGALVPMVGRLATVLERHYDAMNEALATRALAQ